MISRIAKKVFNKQQVHERKQQTFIIQINDNKMRENLKKQAIKK